ncbi:MAG: DUF1838 family protein [Congregibacter sp.]
MSNSVDLTGSGDSGLGSAVLAGSAATRRGFLGSTISGAGLLLAGGGLSQALAQDSRAVLSLDRDSDLLRAFVKMRCSLGPGLNMGWLRGKRFAFSEGRVEPLCGMIAAVFSKLSRVSQDEFEFLMLEVSFYTDFETGALLKTLTMPFSGQEIDVPVHRFGPTPVRIAVKLDETDDFSPASGTNQGAFATAGTVAMSKSIEKRAISGDDLLLGHEEYGRRYPENSLRPSMFYRESTIWSAPLKEVLDPGHIQVDSHVAYSAMTSWRPYMNMGDIPGHTFSNGFGRRAYVLSDLPEDYRAYLREVHPDVLDDPEALLEAYGA